MRFAFKSVVSLLCVCLLSSCWIPEKFTATVSVNKDGSCSFGYDGILTLGIALAAASEGKMTAKDEADFGKEADKMRTQEGFKKVDCLGKGRYQVLVQLDRKAGQPTVFVEKDSPIFSIVPQKDRTIKVSSFKLTPKDITQLNAIGAKVDGELKVNVASGVEVVSQNADSTPKLMGLLGSYVWHIKSPEVAPLIVLRPAS